MRLCKVTGCGRTTTGYSPCCTSHKARERRHGDPQQTTITAARLRPYVQLVRSWVARQPNRVELEAAFAGAVGALLDVAREDATHSRHRPRALASKDILKVCADVPALQVAEVVAAMAILEERDPRAFKTDKAMRMQTARRVRGLTERNCGSYWQESGKCTVRVYRDPSAKAGEEMGRMLLTSLGSIGLRISRLEAAQGDRAAAAKAAVSAALDAAGADAAGASLCGFLAGEHGVTDAYVSA